MWERIDVAGPSALHRLTGIRQQYSSLLMNKNKVPSVEEVLRFLAAWPDLHITDFIPNGRAIWDSIRDGKPLPMASEEAEARAPTPRQTVGGRGGGAEKGAARPTMRESDSRRKTTQGDPERDAPAPVKSAHISTDVPVVKGR